MLKDRHPIKMKEKAPKTLTELKMVCMSQEIREKHDWYKKLNKPDIVLKWKNEMSKYELSDREIQYIIDELEYYAGLKDGVIEVGGVEGTWQSDGLIDEEICKNFKSAVHELLENVDEKERDYHPGSDDLVLDLVHPSLFCFVSGVSKLDNEDDIDKDILDKLKNYKKQGPKKYSYLSYEKSYAHRWLPSEVCVDKDGYAAFKSYINNLPPKKNEILYSIIEIVLSKFLPLFSKVLHDIKYERGNRIKGPGCDGWYEEGPEFEIEEDVEESENSEFINWYANKKLKNHTVDKFTPPDKTKFNEFDLNGEKLQVIVKLANIELTPEKPKYNGGVWHIEGIPDEFIVATGIYYYEVENITESRLLFRQAIEDPLYEQNDEYGVFEIYGLENTDLLVQEIGNLITKEGRCIAFPNTYQHRVAPFELADKGKKGHRKILVFFLVDPNRRVISTKNIAPQNPNWDDEISTTERNTMTLEEAKKYRLDLMSERKYVRDELSAVLYEREFSLCEH